jgi:hypothetical protein
MMSRFEVTVLISICKAVRMSKAAHVPEEAFIRKFSDAREVKKALKDLVSAGYVKKHPTSGGMTYDLTGDGIRLCRGALEQGPNY